MMNVNYIGKKTTVKDSFKEYAEKRLKKLEKFFDDSPSANIVVSNHGATETVEVTIKSRGIFFRAEKSASDRQTAMDLVTDVLHQQIVRNKTRLENRFKEAPAPEVLFENEEQFEIPEAADILVKTKKFQVGVMDAEEAILQMNMLGHEFFMFRSGETGEINVVYRRRDGNYGLLEPIQD